MAVHIYDVPDGDTITTCLTATANGQVLPVHEARVSAVPFNRRWPGHQRTIDQTEVAYFAALEADEPVELCITADAAIESVTVRPLSKEVQATVSGNK